MKIDHYRCRSGELMMMNTKQNIINQLCFEMSKEKSFLRNISFLENETSDVKSIIYKQAADDGLMHLQTVCCCRSTKSLSAKMTPLLDTPLMVSFFTILSSLIIRSNQIRQLATLVFCYPYTT